MSSIKNLEGVKIQLDGTTILESPTILDFDPNDYSLSPDSSEKKKINVSANYRNLIITSSVAVINSGSTRYINLQDMSNVSTVISDVRTYLFINAQLYDMRIWCKASPSDGSVCEYTLAKNNTATSLTLSVPLLTAGATAINSTDTVDITEDDWLALIVHPIGAGVLNMSLSLSYRLTA